jgi:Fur family ferric uptake transcriptional regulator
MKMPTSNLDRRVATRLAERDVRYTAGRRAVVTALSEVDGPRSAAELREIIGEAVPMSSLYRSLAVLEDAGVVSPHYSVKNLARYELAEWLAGHHHHLVCISCGTIDDIVIPSTLERRVEEIVSEIGGLSSFSATNHALEVEGRCARCA